MNIKQAKEQIKYAVKSYFTKDESGDFIIPVERQRPIFLMGPPGIGKTAIMEQIANELGVGIVTYSMTHHTRQSALGLPFIVQKTYGGKEYSVSEYTMSEIIASVYNRIENDGAKEGILFLDEINCVSETLAPSMLQFLQYKIFSESVIFVSSVCFLALIMPHFAGQSYKLWLELSQPMVAKALLCRYYSTKRRAEQFATGKSAGKVQGSGAGERRCICSPCTKG